MNEWELGIAWAAGFFEGEGSVTRHGTQFALQIKNTDLEPLERFRNAVEAGTIYGPYWYDDSAIVRRKAFWLWIVHGEAGLSVLRVLAPWLSRRRLDRASVVLSELKGRIEPEADRTFAFLRTVRQPPLR
jgi:hypothetical protein